MRFFSVLILVLSVFNTKSQSRSDGNIVEYFGRPLHEVADEGLVLHTFSTALVLRDAIKPGLLAPSCDALLWHLAANDTLCPQADQKFVANWHDTTDTLNWTAIVADSNGLFGGIDRTSWIYMHFDAPADTVAIFHASGHTRLIINGMPHEGDHYNFGYTLIPFRLHKGRNHFFLSGGRFPAVRAKIIFPRKQVFFSKKDILLPGYLSKESVQPYGAIKVVNMRNQHLSNCRMICRNQAGAQTAITMDNIMPYSSRKVKFRLPKHLHHPSQSIDSVVLYVVDDKSIILDSFSLAVKIQDRNRHHERTFISEIDGSVQYFSVAPALDSISANSLVLSLHGASVEATNQIRAYKQKDWATIVAPTNRRPFGFNWEEWGRLDALEVLEQARGLFHADPNHTYLTGHSMGGHGTWFMAATYPGLFAAAAPAAAYPDIAGYVSKTADTSSAVHPHMAMIERAANAGRVLNQKRNLLQSGIYVLHGSNDQVVPVEMARRMREELGLFHSNFTYYEYPGGTHWYGDHCMDWPPLFDFLKQNVIPHDTMMNHLEFHTATPVIASQNHWVTVNRQMKQYQPSSVVADKAGDTITLTTLNIESLTVHVDKLRFRQQPVLIVNQQKFNVSSNESVTYFITDQSVNHEMPDTKLLKNPERSGGFKQAFNHRFVMVYATGGSPAENAWYMNKARFDAETFLYRGNGSVDIIPDHQFSPADFPDRNVILYGNSVNNLAWNQLLSHCPVKVTEESISFGNEILKGEDLGTFFIYPRIDSRIASVGVVAASGKPGWGSLVPNDYFSGITGFPDLLIFKTSWLKEGENGILVSGFFGNDWQVENGEFSISPQ